jgi:hypothetical protein
MCHVLLVESLQDACLCCSSSPPPRLISLPGVCVLLLSLGTSQLTDSINAAAIQVKQGLEDGVLSAVFLDMIAGFVSDADAYVTAPVTGSVHCVLL